MAELQQATEQYVMYKVLRDLHDDDYEQQHAHPLLAYVASTDPDTMYMHEAMQQPDREQFIQAMKEEVESQTTNNNWKIVKCKDVPEDATILPAVWAMKCK